MPPAPPKSAANLGSLLRGDPDSTDRNLPFPRACVPHVLVRTCHPGCGRTRRSSNFGSLALSRGRLFFQELLEEGGGMSARSDMARAFDAAMEAGDWERANELMPETAPLH